jgi:hypothetical protein
LQVDYSDKQEHATKANTQDKSICIAFEVLQVTTPAAGQDYAEQES